jgi:hypothetical protein
MKNKKKAAKLPQSKNKWYVYYDLMRFWLDREDGETVRPYFFAVLDPTAQMILRVEALP